MVVEEKKLDELTEKILEGMRRAIKKLVEETAAKNGELVIGDGHGTIKNVPAKELLSIVQSKGYTSLNGQ